VDDGADKTVRLVPRSRSPRPPARTYALAASALVLLVLVAGIAVAWFHRPASPPVSVSAPAIVARPVVRAPPDPFPTATESDILANRASVLSVFRLAGNPAVLVLDFPTLREQARMLNRVALLIETRGQPRDRVLDDAALEAAIRATGAEPDSYYYGHDYRASDLVRFFALADRDAIALNPEEARLRALLRTAGWVDANAVGALISIPTAGVGIDAAARATILRHEISHGEYFTNPIYAAYAQGFWRTELTEAERGGIRRFLTRQEYDPGNEDLMMNEMQAYLVHTADPRFFSAEMIGMTQQRLTALRERFLADIPPGWLRDLCRQPPPVTVPTPISARTGTPRRRRRWAQRGAVSSTRAFAATRPPRCRTASIAA
jgi:hypothetical protein